MNNRKDRFSSKIMEIQPSGIRRFFELCIGHDDIISLGVGEPDFATPWVIREEAFYHLEKGHTSYTSNWGLIELREEISKYLEKYDLHYDAKTEILPTVGASEGLDLVLRTILNPGDELIICEPCYVSYDPLADLCGAKIVHLDTSTTNFYPTAESLEKLITEKTKAVMFCSPSNPTGRIIPPAELEKIAEVVKKHEIWCLSDEIYCELIYDQNKHVSIGKFDGMKDYTIIFNGFSKSFAMTGWRIGYIVAPNELLKQCCKLHAYNTICPPIFSQYAATEGLKMAWNEVEKMRISYQQRRNIMQDAFEKMGLKYIEPEGAFYMFVDIRSTGLTSEEFATEAIQKHSVAVVPGTCFGKCGEGFVRCCYATDIKKINTAMERLSQLVAEHKK